MTCEKMSRTVLLVKMVASNGFAHRANDLIMQSNRNFFFTLGKIFKNWMRSLFGHLVITVLKSPANSDKNSAVFNMGRYWAKYFFGAFTKNKFSIPFQCIVEKR